MFLTYLRRELRRRMRQATLTAASAGVNGAQSAVLHSLYGVGTDITVTKAPTFGAGDGGPFRIVRAAALVSKPDRQSSLPSGRLYLTRNGRGPFPRFSA